MKLYFSLSTTMTRLLTLGMLMMMGLTACHHDDDEVVPTPPPGTDPDPVVVEHKTIRLAGPGNGDDIVLPREGGMYSLFISVVLPEKASDQLNYDWSLSANDYSWFKFNSFDGDASGSGSKLLSFKVGTNAGHDQRELTLTATDTQDKSNQFTFKVIQKGTNGTNTALSDKMKNQGMGYGYNIQMKYASDSAFSAAPILDYDGIIKLETDIGQDIISEVFRYREEIEMLSSNTFTEMSRTFVKEMSEGDSFWGSAQEISKFTTETKRVDQTCSYVRMKEIVSSRTIDLGMITSYGNTVFTQEFRDALRTLDANGDVDDQKVIKFVTTYGTHLCVSADLGGYVAIKTIVDRDTLYTREEITRKITQKRFFISTSSDTKKEISDKYLSNLNPQYRCECAGGTQVERENLEKQFENNGQLDLTKWQASMHDKENSNLYNSALAVVDVRLIPIYDLIDDAMLRLHVRNVIVNLLKKNNIDCSQMTDDKGYDCYTFTLADARSDNDYLAVGHTIEKGADAETKTARVLITREYVPSIRKDALVEVAYPMINGRPYLTRGIFTGDKSHRPGVVRWYRDDSSYEPDTVSYTDEQHAKLFDENGKLRQVYYYFHDIHILPLENLEETQNISISYTLVNKYSKVGPYYWTRQTDGKKIEKDVVLSTLPSQSEVQSLCNIVPYKLIENNTIGLNWPKGFECGTSADQSAPVESTNIYLPVRYQKDEDSDWQLRVTRLSPAGSVPLYTPYIIYPTSSGQKSLLMTPVHCSTSFNY